MNPFIDVLLLSDKEIHKATKHYFLQRKSTSKIPCIDSLAQEWKCSMLESYSYLMLYRSFIRYGSPVSLKKLCKTIHIQKKCFVAQLRLLIYLRFASDRGIIKRIPASSMKLSKTAYVFLSNKMT